ncbi:MAG: T9SS type A sorting domain-containing protein [Bacteroidetes bacterium]|nr:T9SS type A sorting domain-containing protein [Bacteroidota bacterium]
MKVLISILFVGLGIANVTAQNTLEANSSGLSNTTAFEATALNTIQSPEDILKLQYEIAEHYTAANSQDRGGIYESTGNGLTMDQNSPNPCNEITAIKYFIPAPGDIEFRVFNLIGKEVYRSLINAEQGENEFRLDSRDFSQGVYMYTMTYNGETVSKRMVISRK